MSWLPPRPFTRASVQEYRAHLESSGRAPSTVNLRLAPIRKLATEASDNGLLDPSRAAAIARVKGLRRHGVRLGHASLQTTERYLGSRQEIATAVNDHLGIPLAPLADKRVPPRSALAGSEAGSVRGPAAGGRARGPVRDEAV